MCGECLTLLPARFTVTRTQREVLALAAQGMTLARAAQEMWLAPSTARGHAKQLQRRWRARSLPHLVALAIRYGHLPPPRPEPGDPHARQRSRITPGEVRVLRWLPWGHTDAQIAAALGLSPETVRTHMRNLRDRWKCRSRTYLMATAVAYGHVRIPRLEAVLVGETA